MCVNQRWIRNRYTGKEVLVKCGHCKACLQDKANRRAIRIENTSSDELQSFMVNLDYSNDCVPYIKRDDFFNNFALFEPRLRVYRDNFTKIVPCNNEFGYERKLIPNRFCGAIDLFWLDQFNDVKNNRSTMTLPDLKYNPVKHDMFGKIGVCYYPDFQKFVKRLRKEFTKINNGKPVALKYFVCSEYGGRTLRPHFHAVFFVPRRFAKYLYPFVLKCWSFCDWSERRKRKAVLTGRKGLAHYVSTYVNGLSAVPKVFKKSPFTLVWHYSHDFGMGADFCKPKAIQEMYDRRDFRVSKQVIRNGSVATVHVPLPAYILGRYFPKFKGYRVLSFDSLFQLLRRCVSPKFDDIDICGFANRLRLNYDWNDAHNLQVMIRNKYKFFCENFRHGYADKFLQFVEMYYKIWTRRFSSLLRCFHEDDLIYRGEQYDNYYNYDSGFKLGLRPPNHRNVNKYDYYVRLNAQSVDMFDKHYKHKLENNTIFEDDI